MYITIQHYFSKALQMDGNAMGEVFPKGPPGTSDKT